MRRLVVSLALLALVGALVFPSAAAPFSLGQSDAITQDVALAPADSTNGEYAYLGEDDELVVDLTDSNPNLAGDADGVNADGVTRIDDVFTVTYNGSRYAHVWLTHDSDDVTFYADGHPIQSAATNVTLGPNQSVAVGLRVDTRGETTDGLIDDVTVHATVAEPEDSSNTGGGGGARSSGTAVALRAPNATARSVTVVAAPDGTPTTIDLDGMSACRDDDAITLEEATIDREGGGDLDLRFRALRPPAGVSPHTESLCTVRATEIPERDTVAEATFRFSVDRAALARWNVSAEELVVFRTDGEDPTELLVRVVGRSDRSVRFAVETPELSQFTVAAARPDVTVTAASLGRTEVGPNETITVTGRVENDGRTDATHTVPVALNGSPVATQSVTLAPGETTRIAVSVGPQTPGRYTVTLGNTTAGTVSVARAVDATPAATGDDRSSDAPTWGPAGLGVGEVVTLLGLLATTAGLVGVRRWFG